ncbi:MAG: hypothetical protein OXE42_16975 [Gammaproteobacteria bacterium]|nr:hypothetical protein [Gammaproteobacteria bacterium]
MSENSVREASKKDVLLGMDFLLGFRLTLYKSRFTLSIPQAE